MAGSNPAAAVATVLAGLVAEGIIPPEPFGIAHLVGNAEIPEDAKQLTSEQDTLTPMWSNEPVWHHVLLSSRVRLHVDLMDSDYSNDDPIGSFELNEHDLEAALASGHVYQVKVADQTYNQILFAGVVVSLSNDSTVIASSEP